MCNWLKYFIGDLRSAFIYIIQQNAAAQKDEFPLIPVNSLFPLQRWEADVKSCFHAFSSRLLPTNPVSSVSCTEQHMTQMNSLRTCADLKATNGKIYSLEAKLFLLPVGWRCQRQKCFWTYEVRTPAMWKFFTAFKTSPVNVSDGLGAAATGSLRIHIHSSECLHNPCPACKHPITWTSKWISCSVQCVKCDSCMAADCHTLLLTELW